MIYDFLNLKSNAFGLDISALSIKIVQLRHSRGKFGLSAYGEVAVPSGIIQNGVVQKSNELAKVIRKAIKEVHGKLLDMRHAIVSLPEEKAFLQVIQLPLMEPDQVAAAIRFEAENYIPYSLNTVYLDSQLVSPLRNHLNHIDVLLASLPRTIIDAYLDAVKNAGIVPLVFEIESLAVTRALIPNEISSAPRLLIDLGATRTSFIIFAGSSLRFTASIPISSSQMTQQIAKSLKLSEKQAEDVKRQYGVAGMNDPRGREVFDALTSPLADLVGQIKRYMSYYESHADHQHLPVKQRAITSVMLCGGGANLPGLPEFLQKELGIKARIGNPWVNILPSPIQEVPGLSFKDSVRYTSALGLALRGIRGDI